MIKNISILLLIIVVLSLGAFLFFQNKTTTPPPSSTDVTIQPTGETQGCRKDQIKADISIEPAAGNIYAVATLTNSGNTTCTLSGDNYVELAYDKERYSNINEATIGPIVSQTFDVAPQTSLYAHLRYPNGPQCSEGVVEVPFSFVYELPMGDRISFVDVTGQDTFSLQACQKRDEITELHINPFSTDKEL